MLAKAAAPAPSSPFSQAMDGFVSDVGARLEAEQIAALHRAFELRTGAFGPDDPWVESRSRAFWDDTLTRQPATRDMFLDLPSDDPRRPWALALGRSHRGLFRWQTEGGRVVLFDLWSGIELVVHEMDLASRDALSSASGDAGAEATTGGPFDGTVIATEDPVRLALLPGAIFHPEDATPAIVDIVSLARKRHLTSGHVLDALLRMELSLRVLSRVKPSYAYRPEALGA